MRPSHSFSRAPSSQIRPGATGGAVQPARPAAPPAPAPIVRQTSISSSFDDEFGDGSDLMEIDANIIAPIIVKQEQHTNNANAHTVQQQPIRPPPPLPNPPPALPPTALSQRFPQPNVHASPAIASFNPTSNTSHPPGSLEARLAEAESKLLEKTGEAKLLRSKLEATERRRVVEAATRASTTSTSASFSSSQIPSSQQLRKQENEAQTRIQMQLETIRVEKESTQMQLGEYMQENNQLRKKMEAMEKMQQQLQNQLKQKATAAHAASPAALIAHASPAMNQSARPPIPYNGAQRSPVISTTMSNGSVAAAASPRKNFPPTEATAGVPMDTSSSMTVSSTSVQLMPRSSQYAVNGNKWTLPSFLSQLSVRPLEPGEVAHIVPVQQLDVPEFSKLMNELSTFCSNPSEISSSSSSSSPDLLDHLGSHVMFALQNSLSQTAPLSSIVEPVKQMLLACTVQGQTGAFAQMTIPMQSTKRLTANNVSQLQPQRSGSPAPAAASSSDGWERAVRVKLEHQQSTGRASIAPQSEPNAKVAALIPTPRLRPGRDSKQLRGLQSILLRLLHSLLQHDIRCVQMVYGELVDSPSSQSIASSSAASTLTLPHTDTTKLLADMWTWQPSGSTKPPAQISSAATPASNSPSSLDKILESLSWSTALMRIFDDSFSRLYADRVERANGTGQSSSGMTNAIASSIPALSIIELVCSVLQMVVSRGVSRLEFIAPSAEATRAMKEGQEGSMHVWIPRLAQLVARMQANAAAKYPIVVANSIQLEGRVYLSVSDLASHWCRYTIVPPASMLQSTSSVSLPGRVKSSSLEASTPCSCSLLQILALHALQQLSTQPIHLQSPSPPDAPANWYEVMVRILGAIHRTNSHHHSALQRSDPSHLQPCIVHAREWEERDSEPSLQEASLTLFFLPYALLRLLVRIIHEAVTRLQQCTHQQVATLCDGSFDHTGSSTPHPCTILILSGSLELLSSCLHLQHRRWNDVRTDASFKAESKLHSLLQDCYESAEAIKLCKQQLHGSSPAAEKRLRAGHEHQWLSTVRIATEIHEWINVAA